MIETVFFTMCANNMKPHRLQSTSIKFDQNPRQTQGQIQGVTQGFTQPFTQRLSYCSCLNCLSFFVMNFPPFIRDSHALESRVRKSTVRRVNNARTVPYVMITRLASINGNGSNVIPLIVLIALACCT